MRGERGEIGSYLVVVEQVRKAERHTHINLIHQSTCESKISQPPYNCLFGGGGFPHQHRLER